MVDQFFNLHHGQQFILLGNIFIDTESFI